MAEPPQEPACDVGAWTRGHLWGWRCWTHGEASTPHAEHPTPAAAIRTGRQVCARRREEARATAALLRHDTE